MRDQGGAKARKPTQTIAVLGMCLILVVVFSVSLKGFLTLGNMFALARNISILGILALGMAIVVIGRGLDLSQVASFAASTAIAIILMNSGYATPIALLGVGTRVVRNRTLRSNGSGTHAARRSPAGRRSDLKPSSRCCSLSQV